MKYTDFQKQLEANNVDRGNLEEATTWRWSLGGGPNIAYFEYRPFYSNGINLAISDFHPIYGFEVLELLSPNERRVVVEIFDTIARWKAGEIETLPPSGAWKGAASGK